jgi:hypothetical protein
LNSIYIVGISYWRFGLSCIKPATFVN